MQSSLNATIAPLGFAIRFVLAFAVLVTAFEASRGTQFERFVVERLILTPTAALINIVTPADQVEPVGRTLLSPGRSQLRVTRGCEGLEMMLLLVAAIAATPASPRRRLQGLINGIALAYALGVARLMALHYVLQYWPDVWETMHGLILPLAPILVLALFFMRWLPHVAPPTPELAQADAV